MFEQETDTIINIARQRIPHSIFDSSSVVLKDIIAADIPHPLKTFFRADVEILLNEELARARKTSRFNYNHPEVQGLQQQMNSVLVMHYVFKRDEFHQRLDDAVHMLINFLVRPQWTLTNVLFEAQETISASALLRLLRYFGPYEYLRSLILRYIEDRKIESFTRAEFSDLIWKVDDHYFRRKTGYEVAKILTPLYEFISYPGDYGDRGMTTKALTKYFSDKGLMLPVRMLEDELAQGRESVPQKELGEMLERIRRNSGAFVAEPRSDQDRVRATANELVGERLQSDATVPEEDFEAEPSPSVADQNQTSSPDREQTMTAPPPERTISTNRPPQAPALLRMINESDHKRFVKKIFKQDNNAFLDALRRIEELSTWRQASVYIDEIFIANDIDPYSPEAVRFIDIIQEKYYPKR